MKTRALTGTLFVALLCALVDSAVARPPVTTQQSKSGIGQFSFVAPKGWRLVPATNQDKVYTVDPTHSYLLSPIGRSETQCWIAVRTADAATPAAAQSLKVVRKRSGVFDTREDEIRRSELRSVSGIRIWKADLSTGYSSPYLKSPLLIRSILYSFRGSDSRVYTLECGPTHGNGAEFERPLDEVAKSIKF